MSSKTKISLSEFLEYFPVIDLPITLKDQLIHEISKVNKIFPVSILAQYFSVWEGSIDETMEILPCCQLPIEDDFHAIVYWKASLLSYEFVLATLDKDGVLITKKVVAGLISNGSTLLQSVAKIDEDLSIQIVIGEKKVEDPSYDAENSKGHYMEILPNGQLISSKDDELLWQEKNTKDEN